MSAYAEKKMAQVRIRELNKEIAETQFALKKLETEKLVWEGWLEEAEQDIKWEAQNDR